MRAVRWVLAGLAIVVVCGIGLWQIAVSEEPALVPLPCENCQRFGGLTVAPALEFKNLAIYPVVSNDPRDIDRYITLDEGLLSGDVQIREIGAVAVQGDDPRQQGAQPSGSVNQLVVINNGSKPLYLMSGEVIMGGKQDRSLADSMLVQNDGKPVPVNVFCVEHGRWHLRSAQETQRLAMQLNPSVGNEAAARLAKQATSGALVLSSGALSKSSRFEVNKGTDQGKVWRNVDSVNGVTGNTSTSSAYTENFTRPDVRQQFAPYIDAIERKVSETEHVVGVVVAINGRMEMADVFDEPLFQKFWPKLMKSYALDAAMMSAKPQATKSTQDDARRFYEQSQTAEVEKTEQRAGVQLQVRALTNLSCFVTSPVTGEPKAAPPAVHTAVFAK